MADRISNRTWALQHGLHGRDLLTHGVADTPPPGADMTNGSATSGCGDTGPPIAFYPSGTRVGQYELIRVLGRGGMGVVHLARDTKLGRRVAIKFLHNTMPACAERFVVEAQNTARCSHENIVVIHDVDTYDRHPFMVLEYLKGQPLSRLVAKGTMPPGRAVQLMVPIVRALRCAHQYHIIHRDLKPDNVLVTNTGIIKVLDFGISKFINHRPPQCIMERKSTTFESVPQRINITRQGMFMGTLPYMSPEQWNGEEPDYRSDLWAAGIILYEMVVGRHPLAPFCSDTLQRTAELDEPMPSAHHAGVDMPPALADIIDSCLAKRRAKRVASAAKLLEALESLLPHRHSRELRGNESPYAGLNAFQEADADRFFGRSGDISILLTRLQEEPLIGVIGPSGVGKSSFVRAGVIPALKQSGDTWESHVIRPGREPLAALAGVVGRIVGDNPDTPMATGQDSEHEIRYRLRNEPGYLGTVLRTRARKLDGRVVLFVDQFEELYTLTSDMDERMAFTAALRGAADDVSTPLRVLISLRSDFLDRVAEDHHFMTELNQGLYFLTQPDRAGLREAIERPAEMAGYRFEAPWIVDSMLDCLQTTADALPLLQFAASRLWETRSIVKQLLTERSYRSIGGVEGALASHANAVLASLPPREQALVRAIFLQLVTAERTRALAMMSELRELSDEVDIVQSVIEHLVSARLLVVHTGDAAAGSMVEIVHESLLHSWPVLDYWLDENQGDAVFLEELRTAARQWDKKGRPYGLLWRGEAAREAGRWHSHYRGYLPRVQKEYLDAVFSLASRSTHRKRMLIASTMTILVVLVVATTIGLLWIRNAEKQARDAAREARAAEMQARMAETQAREAETQAREAEKQAREAEKQARDKEQTIRTQYHELQAEKEAREQAQKSLEQSEKVLAVKNQELRAALASAQRAEAMARTQSDNAQRAALRAERKAEEARQARAEVERLYKREQARLKKLEQQLGSPRARILN